MTRPTDSRSDGLQDELAGYRRMFRDAADEARICRTPGELDLFIARTNIQARASTSNVFALLTDFLDNIRSGRSSSIAIWDAEEAFTDDWLDAAAIDQQDRPDPDRYVAAGYASIAADCPF